MFFFLLASFVLFFGGFWALAFNVPQSVHIHHFNEESNTSTVTDDARSHVCTVYTSQTTSDFP